MRFNKSLGRIIISALIVSTLFSLSACTTSKERQEQFKADGVAALNKGDYAKAVELFNEALSFSEGSVDDGEIDICYYKAAAQANNNDAKGAAQTYTALMEYDEDNPYPCFLRGSVYLKSGEKSAAIEDYKEAIKRDEENWDLYIAIYENLSAMNFENEAQEFLNIALEKSGDSKDECIARGRMYALMKQYDAAKTAFEKAKDKGSEDADIYLANMYLEQGKESECDKILETYKDKSDISSLACNAIAGMEIKRGHPEEALAYVNMGLDKFSVDNRKDLLRNRVAAYEYMGSFSEAFTYATEFLQEYPNDVDMTREVSFLSTRV
ncbi:MAG: hypothetical protein K5644_09240 [Lachnospiraceae bacterium]|nr:hypothetical protein [Lachnospiraceae bacterium]